MTDVEPHVEHFRFTPSPEFCGTGVAFTPLMGEVEPDHIYPVFNEETASILRSHSDWESVSKQEFDSQEESEPDVAEDPDPSPVDTSEPPANRPGRESAPDKARDAQPDADKEGNSNA